VRPSADEAINDLKTEEGLKNSCNYISEGQQQTTIANQ
jgi:hypothetical protein